jgi:hypothetical protein
MIADQFASKTDVAHVELSASINRATPFVNARLPLSSPISITSSGRMILTVCVNAELRTLSSTYCKALNANVADTPRFLYYLMM